MSHGLARVGDLLARVARRLEARDAPRLAAILKGHLRNKCEAVKEVLRTDGKSDEAAA